MTRTTLWSFIVITILSVPAAKAGDTIESLDFTGTATCETGFGFQECSSGSGGPITGNYDLDVTTQTIVGDWSFTTPYFVISSSMDGSNAGVTQEPLANGLNDEASFEIAPSSGLFFVFLDLDFPAPDADELGAVYFGGTSAGSSICQPIPSIPGGCEPDVAVAGSTTAATPEPSGFVLLLTGLLGMVSVLRLTKRSREGC